MFSVFPLSFEYHFYWNYLGYLCNQNTYAYFLLIIRSRRYTSRSQAVTFVAQLCSRCPTRSKSAHVTQIGRQLTHWDGHHRFPLIVFPLIVVSLIVVPLIVVPRRPREFTYSGAQAPRSWDLHLLGMPLLWHPVSLERSARRNTSKPASVDWYKSK